MNSYYSVMLQLNGKKVMVVGGGKVAERKIYGLLTAKADITVISPEVSGEISMLVNTGKIKWRKKLFENHDIKDAFMIFAATNDRKLNQTIKEAAGVNQLVTISDDPDRSDFHVPAQVRRGRLNISISTGGASPVLARKIRGQLEQEFDEQYEGYLEFLYWARQIVLQEVDDPLLKRNLLIAIAKPAFLESRNREDDFLKLYKEMRMSY